MSEEQEVSDIFEEIAEVRRKTRQRSNPNNDIRKYMAVHKSVFGKYNLPIDEIERLQTTKEQEQQPPPTAPDRTASIAAEEAFLEDLVPLIIPDDSYFLEDEIESLIGGESPLRFPIKHYISKQFLILPKM